MKRVGLLVGFVALCATAFAPDAVGASSQVQAQQEALSASMLDVYGSNTLVRQLQLVGGETDAQLREKAEEIFDLFLLLNPSFHKNEPRDVRFERFHGSVFREMINYAVNNFEVAPAPGPNPAPGPAPGPNPGPNPAPGPNPGPAPGPNPGPAPGPNPGPAPGPNPGPAPGPNPGPAPGPNPGPAPGPNPGPAPGPNPGPAPGPNPGPAPALEIKDKTEPKKATNSQMQLYLIYYKNKEQAELLANLDDNSDKNEQVVSSSSQGSNNQNTDIGNVVVVDEDDEPVEGRRLAEGKSKDTLLFCDIGSNAIWRFQSEASGETTPAPGVVEAIVSPTDPSNVNVDLCAPEKKVEIKVNAFQSGCSRQNHPEGCDDKYYKGCSGITVDPTSSNIFVARNGGRTLGKLSYAQVNGQCQGRVDDFITHYEGRRFNSPTFAEVSANGHLYFTDSPFGLARSAADFEGDTLDKLKGPSDIPFNGVYVVRKGSREAELIDCSMDRPNKIAFSPDQKHMYVTNSRKGNSYVKVFKIKENGLADEAGVFFNFTKHDDVLQTGKGHADGIRVDDNGIVYVAAYDGVFAFTPEGELISSLRGVDVEFGALGMGSGRLFISGSFGVLAQTNGAVPSMPVPKAKTTC